MTLDLDARYILRGQRDVAFYVRGPQMIDDEDTVWTGYQVPTGMVEAVMVGDDRVWVVDPDDLTAIQDDEYCSSCGQVGCTADGRG